LGRPSRRKPYLTAPSLPSRLAFHAQYKPIRGLFYVRVLEVQVPPSKEFLALGHRTPYV
jgi:hypothetical protein